MTGPTIYMKGCPDCKELCSSYDQITWKHVGKDCRKPNKRITKTDLLLRGWHRLYYGRGGTRWAHPLIPFTLTFKDAAKLARGMKNEMD